MIPNIKRISESLFWEWHDLMRNSMKLMKITQQDLADACMTSRQTISYMLNKPACRPTGLQFLGTTLALAQLAAESDKDLDLIDRVLQKIDDCNRHYFNKVREGIV